MTDASSPTPQAASPTALGQGAVTSFSTSSRARASAGWPLGPTPLRLRRQGRPLGPQASYGRESRPGRQAAVRTMPPAGDRPAPGWRGRRRRLRVRSGVRGELPSRPPSTQAEPSRRGPWRPGRSYSGALHLDAMNHARSTVCGSTADGMGAGVSGGLRWTNRSSRHDTSRQDGCHAGRDADRTDGTRWCRRWCSRCPHRWLAPTEMASEGSPRTAT